MLEVLFAGSPFLIHLLCVLGINIILSSSLNIINGYCGLFSLGHAGFFAIGAYTAAAFSLYGPQELVSGAPILTLLIGCLLAMLAASLAGFLIGLPSLRLSGDYLAIATLGFGEIIRIIIINMESLGGPRGLPGIPRLVSLDTVVIAVMVSLLIMTRIVRSSYGRCIVAVREDEIAARAMGVNVLFYKVYSFVLGSSFAGLAGALFAHYQQFISPTNFTFLITVQILVMTVIGGLGSMVGAVLGAIAVTFIPELLRFSDTLSQVRIMIFGIVLVLMMLIQPRGLMGLYRKAVKSRVSV